MNLHAPHHLPRPDAELLGLLAALGRVLLLMAAVVAIWWVATYGGGGVITP